MCGLRGWEAAYYCLEIANLSELFYEVRDSYETCSELRLISNTSYLPFMVPDQLLCSMSEYLEFGKTQGLQLAAFHLAYNAPTSFRGKKKWNRTS